MFASSKQKNTFSIRVFNVDDSPQSECTHDEYTPTENKTRDIRYPDAESGLR